MEQVIAAIAAAQQAAKKSADEYLLKHGDHGACGFSWVTVLEKGNTKLGRALIKAGFQRGISRSGLQWWNPSGVRVQSVDCIEAGSEAAATVLQNMLGVRAYAESRLD